MQLDKSRNRTAFALTSCYAVCSDRNDRVKSGYLLVKLIFILISAALILSGCSTAVRKTIVVPVELSPSSPKKVQAVEYTDEFNEPCNIIGGILVSSDMKESSRIKVLKKEAAKVGADAVVGMYHNHHHEYCCPFMTGGLAVQLTDDRSSTKPPEKDFIVAIFESPLSSAKIDLPSYVSNTPSWTAQSVMADKGYFPIIMDSIVPENDKDYLKRLNFSDLETYCGEKFDYVLILDLFESETGTIIYQTSKIKSSAALYSVRDNKLVWENIYNGEARTSILFDPEGGLLFQALTGGKIATIKAIDNTVRGLLKPLKEVESTIGCDGFIRAGDCNKSSYDVVITHLLPNPDGKDRGYEEVTIRNRSESSIDLNGWKLKDRDGNLYYLSGTVKPKTYLTFIMKKPTMTLNNTGDDVYLIDAEDRLSHHVSYTADEVYKGDVLLFD